MVTFLVVVSTVAIVGIIINRVISSPTDAAVAARTAVELHRTRRKLEMGILRAQMKSDAAQLRREFDEQMKE